MNWVADCFVRFRWLVGLILLAVTLVATWGYAPERVSRPALSASTIEQEDSDADTEDEAWRRDEAISNSFDMASSNAFLVVECDDLFRAESIRTVRGMVRAIEALPIVDSVFWFDSLPTLNVFGFAEPLIPANDAVPEAFFQAKERALNHPLVRGQLLSPDGKTMIMPVVYNWLYLQEEADLDEDLVQVARNAIEEQLDAMSAGAVRPKFRVRITGRVPLYLAREAAFARNQTMFRILGYGLALLLSIVLFRGVTAVLIVSAAPMLGIYWSIGLMKLFDVHINELANAVMPVLVSMIGLTDGVHLLVNIRERRSQGATPLEAARWTIEHVGVACFLTSLTTAIGFGSLALAHSEYVQDFGRVCMYGVVIAFLAVILFIPFVSSLPLARNVHRGKELDFVSPYLLRYEWVLEAILARRRLASGIAIVVTLALAIVSLKLHPDNRIANQLPSSSEAYQALAHCDRKLGGIQYHQLRVRWSEETPDDAPEILAAIRDAEVLLADEPLMSFPLSIRSMLASFPGDPDDLQTQMTFLSLLPRDLRGFFYHRGDRRAVIVSHVQDQGIAQYEPVFDRLDDRLDKLEAKHPGFEFSQGGGPIYTARDLHRIVVDLSTSLGTASIVILVVLAVVYRSLRIGLISVVPNMFPLVATGALLIAMGEPLFVSSVCAFTVCLGIAVDDTIHFLSRYHQELKTGADVDEAVRQTYFRVGTPMVMTTIILVTGFSSVLLSDLPAHRIFGAMACTTIAAAIIGDLFALPALLSCFAPRRDVEGTEASRDTGIRIE